jgi:hypothetical protein
MTAGDKRDIEEGYAERLLLPYNLEIVDSKTM